MNWKNILKVDKPAMQEEGRKLADWVQNNAGSSQKIMDLERRKAATAMNSFSAEGNKSPPYKNSAELIAIMNNLDRAIKGNPNNVTAQDYLENIWKDAVGIGKPNKPQAENEFWVLF